MFVLWHLYAFYIVLVPCRGEYAGQATKRINAKIVYLGKELLKDAIRKIDAVAVYKNYYRDSYEFVLAGSIHGIRIKYRRMVKVYQVAFEKMPSEGHYYHVPRLLETRQLSSDIDHLVEAIVELETKREIDRKKRVRASERKAKKSRNVTELETSKGNKTLRAGKPKWSFKSENLWGYRLPELRRAAVPPPQTPARS